MQPYLTVLLSLFKKTGLFKGQLFWCALCLAACAQTQPKAVASDFAFENLGDGIYVHHGKHLDIDEGYQGDICNISFVVGDKGVAVIDTGGSLKVGQQLRAVIKKVTDKPILYVINTHVHPDHIFGNAAFVTDKPAFVGHEKLANAMLNRKESYDKLNVKFLGKDAAGSETIVPTQAVKDVAELDIGGRTLKVNAYSLAHTHTDISVIDSKTNTLFTGDLLFVTRTPVLEGDLKGLLATMETLKNLKASQVVPGHGGVAKTAEAGTTAFNNATRYLSKLLSDVRADIKAGKSLEQSMETAASNEKANWELFDVANRRNVNIVYPQLEWE